MAARLFDKAGWIVAGVLALLLVAALAGVVLGGPLDPPASPGATQPQVEPRNPIPPVGWNGSFPITISQPGSYFLTRNLTGVSGEVGILVDSDGVTLDLNGFSLIGVPGASFGVDVFPGGSNTTFHNIVVRNGTIRSWSTGIDAVTAVGGRFEDLQLEQNGLAGLYIGEGNIVSRVQSRGNINGMIMNAVSGGSAGLIDHSIFAGNTQIGVEIDGNNIMVRDNVIDGNGTYGLYVVGSWNDIQDNKIVANSGYGVHLGGGGSHLVAHNVIAGNAGGAMENLVAANRVGPAVTDAALNSSDPWSNVEY